MAKLVRRAWGWLYGRLEALAGQSCRAELSKLRAQQHELVAALDAVDDLVVLSYPDGRLRFANRAAASLLEELTGRDPKQLLGKLPTELGLPDELLREILLRSEEVRATRAVVTDEVALPRRGGERWYEQKLSPVLADGGRLSAQVTIGRDIDERKRAQRRLALLAKVSTLVGDLDFDELLSAIARLSVPELADWSLVDAHDGEALHRILVAHREPGGDALAARLEHYHPAFERARWDDLQAGRSLLFEDVAGELRRTAPPVDAGHLALVREMGMLSTIVVPLRVRGATVAMITFITTTESGRRYDRDDLTLAEELGRRAAIVLEQARLHAELEASDARFRVALAMARTAVYEQDRELRYRWSYNIPAGVDFVGKTPGDLFARDLAEQITAVKRRVLETGEPVRGEMEVTIDGEPRVLMTAIDPLRDDGGAIVGIIGASTDITEERRMREELAQAVTFREQLMGILGHDLRNPLSAILAATGSLRRRPGLARPVLDHVERVDRAARRMAEMIGTVLDFTQVRFHGGLPVSPAPTDLADVARAIVDELRAAEPDRRIELEARGDARGQWDPARLGQLLSNLVGNALVHGEAGEPVRVAIDGGDGDVWLRVHNAGAAIPPETRPELFEPFRRGAPHGTARARGLGLGLYIVRQIALAHEGSVTVDSTPADGTTFTVRLPRGSPPERAAPRGTSPVAG